MLLLLFYHKKTIFFFDLTILLFPSHKCTKKLQTLTNGQSNKVQIQMKILTFRCQCWHRSIRVQLKRESKRLGNWAQHNLDLLSNIGNAILICVKLNQNHLIYPMKRFQPNVAVYHHCCRLQVVRLSHPGRHPFHLDRRNQRKSYVA